MTRGRALIVLALVGAAGAVVSAASEIRITPIVSEGRVLVSFTARDSWTLGSREVLEAGTPLAFEYEIELRRPGPWPLWFLDSVLARTRITSQAKFNTLTGGYTVGRMREGRLVSSERCDQEADVREWLTTVDHVALDPVSPLEPNAEYYVHVRLTIRPLRNFSLWSVLPFGREENAGRAAFPYITGARTGPAARTSPISAQRPCSGIHQ